MSPVSSYEAGIVASSGKTLHVCMGVCICVCVRVYVCIRVYAHVRV